MASFMDEKPVGVEGLTLETNNEQNAAIGVGDATDATADAIKYSKLAEDILEKFGRSKSKRMFDENRWLECYRNYRGKYGPSTQFTKTEKSKAFIKVTKTKVLAAGAKISEVLFAGNKFPIGIEASRDPVGVEGAIHFDPQDKTPPTAAKKNSQMDPHIAKIFGPKQSTLKKVEQELKSGSSMSPTAVNFNPAKDAARKMEKKIHDQLDETNASKSLRELIHELCLFGHGVYKGPLLTEKEYPRWDENGNYNPMIRRIPFTEFVSIWDSYPDADARNMDEAEYFIQRHRLSKTELRELKKRPLFRKKIIEELISEGPNYQELYWENALRDDNQNQPNERWEVLEYWGLIDAEMAKEQGLTIPKEFRGRDEVQINAWISGGKLLRLVFNPFVPVRIPYHSVPYELNPYSFFGVGVAENMLDTQLLMNGFMRLAVDNAALSSNIIFEVNEDYLSPGQSMDIYPGKVFRRQGGAPGQAFNAQKIDNVTQETLALFDKARQLADEATGMPSYAHGMTGVQSVNRTASGMSMLMGAAAENIKAVVRNLDDYLLSPLGKDLFAFNMQYNFDKDFIGDLSVVAKGTESLMRNEVRSQKLLQLAQFAASNPAITPLVKWDYIMREYAVSMDLDEDEIINDPREAQVQALLMSQLQGMMTPPEAGPPGTQPPGGQGAPPVSDPTGTGNGNIAPGQAPEPGAAGFTSPLPDQQAAGTPPGAM